jgi:hypothetical protein
MFQREDDQGARSVSYVVEKKCNHFHLGEFHRTVYYLLGRTCKYFRLKQWGLGGFVGSSYLRLAYRGQKCGLRFLQALV